MVGKKKKRSHARRLWLNIKWKNAGNDRDLIRRTLIESIRRGDYTYPENWRVIIEWRNDEFGDMRRGEFTQEMIDSAISSNGFDKAVLGYLRGTR